jgi:hypothetical protein
MTARTVVFLCFIVSSAALFSQAVFAETLDCLGGMVFVDDARADVLMKCGEPDWKDSHQEELSERVDGSTKLKLIITVEEWTYNFGPGRFLYGITLKNGKVADIRSGDYGYAKSAKPEKKPGPRECGDRIISVGDSMNDVLMKCGEPAWKDSRREELKERLSDGRELKTLVTVEVLHYNFGPNRFTRIFTFKNGKVTDIRTGDYGY